MILLVVNNFSKEQKQTIEDLYIRLKTKMYATSLNILKDTYDAEDAVSNTFIQIAENYHLVKKVPSHKIDQYCITILKNESYKIYNKRKKETPTENLDINIGYIEDEEALIILDKNQIEHLMKKLNEDEITFLKLKYYREWTYEEISNFLGITNSTARKRHQRILEKMRREDI